MMEMHTLVTMEEIVEFLIEEKKITPNKLRKLVRDYTECERWYVPKSANRKGAV